MKKHILCLGDSNTYGYCADISDCKDACNRFNEQERWTCLLQEKMGDNYLVIEEGLQGRTTVFADPLHENLDTISYITAILKSHKDIDLLIVMLGTNDTKDRFGVTAAEISMAMQRLLEKAISVDCWKNKTPNILLVAPAPIGEKIKDTHYVETMGSNCSQKSKQLAKYYQKIAQSMKLHFLNADGCDINKIDFTHLTRQGHIQLSEKIYSKLSTILQD